MAWDRVIFSRQHLSVKTLHRRSSERRHLHYHLVEDAASGPHVAAIVVGHILPDFGAGVVWGTCLRTHHATLRNTRDVHIAEFDHSCLSQKHIGAFDVPVANSQIMKSFQTPDHLNEKVPDLALRES